MKARVLSIPAIRSKIERSRFGQGPRVGVYSVHPGDPELRLVSVAVPCPYCRAHMHRRDVPGQMRRIVDVESITDTHFIAMTVVIPDTYWVVRCDPCDARFVVPVAVADRYHGDEP